MTYRVITATLTARTAIHIGSGKGNEVTDALLRRDAQGRPFIPGTAIAGALRSLLTRLAPRLGFDSCVVLSEDDEKRKRSCSCAVCHLFGDINPSDGENSSSTASRVLLFNAVPVNLPSSLIRDGVGIDRVTGAAARTGGIKFDLEVLPAGAEFELRIELNNPSPEDERLLAAGLAEWLAGRMWLGGRVARGLGAFDLSNLKYKVWELQTVDQVLAFLKDEEPWKRAKERLSWLDEQTSQIKPVPDTGKVKTVSRGWVMITGTLQAEGPLLTNDVTVAAVSGFDHAPLLIQMGDWQEPVLPGSGLRGVLRSHAERLVRTVTTMKALQQPEAEQKAYFLTHCPACDPNRRAKDKDDPPIALETCDSLLKRAEESEPFKITYPLLSENLCLACRLFGSARLGSRLVVEDAPFAGEKPVFKMLDFLAIDRFTGGGVKGFKFDALALWKPAFKLRLYLENPEPWELGWLSLVLRDLAEGWLSVGFGTAKGFGRVRLVDWNATFGYLTPDDMSYLPHCSLVKSPSRVYTTVQVAPDSSEWNTMARKWLQAFHEKVEAFTRQDKIALSQDTYFGWVDHLYTVGGDDV